MDQILEKWDEILMTVKTEHDISDIAFNTFLRPLEFYGVTGNTAYILVPSEQLGLSYISKKYYLPLKVAITEITGTEYEIKFILPEQAKSIASSPNKQKKPFYSEAASKSNLNSNYTLSEAIIVLPTPLLSQLRNLQVKHTILSIFMEDRDSAKHT